MMEDDSRYFHDLLPAVYQDKSARSDNELVELLWQNGHVVMHSQAHRKPTSGSNVSKQAHKLEPPLKCGVLFENSDNLLQEEEAVSWLQYSLADSLEKEFCSDFFYGLPTPDSSVLDKPSNDVMVEDSNAFADSVSKPSGSICYGERTAPPESQINGSIQQSTNTDSGVINFAHFSNPVKADSEQVSGHLGRNRIPGEVGGSSSMMTKGLSYCGSNHVPNQVDQSCSNDVMASVKVAKEDTEMKFNCERTKKETHEATFASSSGGSGCSFGRAPKSYKRKGMDADESECQSEDAEYESAEASKPAHKSASVRRSRVAEVHNLSERRRRDRINEKLKALQELIPHCNKSDKASMLDEAIEYLKSLQLQVQIMWMGSGMAPMMVPGVRHFMPRLGMGMGHCPMPSIHSPVQYPRAQLVNQSMTSTSAANQAPVYSIAGFNPANFPNQMQNSRMAEYARYLGFQHMQPSPQPMDLYAYSSQLMQKNQTTVPASSSDPPNDGAAPSENISFGKSGRK